MEVLGRPGLLNDSLPAVAASVISNISRQQTQQDILYITDNRVTDSQLTTSLWLNALLGLIFFLSFCVLQRSVFPQHYRFRSVSNSCAIKPRPLPTKGFYSLWAWLWMAWDVNEDEIMRSSGLDAVVMIKALQMGVEIFAPLALVGCAVLLPVHYQFKGKDDMTGFSRSQLMQLTIAALPRGSDVMWLHFALCICYNLWVMWVLSRYFKDFVLVRQHYLSKGDDPNYWVKLTQQADAEYVAKKVRKMLADINQPGSKQPSGAGAEQAPELEQCISPQMERASTANGKQSWLREVANGIKQRMSRTNVFSLSSDSYRPYTGDVSAHHSPAAGSMEGSEQRITLHTNWAAAGPQRTTAAGGLTTSTAGSEGMDGSLRTSKDSLDGLGSGPATAAGSESGGSNAGGVLSGGGKRWSSGSSNGAGAQAVSGSEGGSAATGSSRGGADHSSGSESSGGGAMAVMDAVGRKLRLSGSKGSRGAARTSIQLTTSSAAAGSGGGAPLTYQTINELQTMTAAQSANSSGTPTHLPKHMRTITEDSLEYRLDSSWGAHSRPSSRGGTLAPPSSGARNSSSSGADFSPCAAVNRAAYAAALAAGGSTSGLLSTDGSSGSGSQQSLQVGGAFGSGGAPCGPSTLSRGSSEATAAGGVWQQGPAAAASMGANSLVGSLAYSQAEEGGTPTLASVSASRVPSLGAGLLTSGPTAQHTSRESAAHMRASITSMDSIDERSSVGTCIIHNSAPSSPGIEGCSESSSRGGSPMPEGEGSDSSHAAIVSRGRDISLAGDVRSAGGGICLQGPFAEAARAASSSGCSSRSGGEPVCDLDHGPLPSVGSGQQLQQHLEATLGSVCQEDVSVIVVEESAAAAPAAGSSRGGRGHRQQQRRHTKESSVDFSKQHLPDLSHVDVSLLDPVPQDSPTSSRQPLLGEGAAKWSPFANSDGIASTIAAAGVALVASDEPWGPAVAAAAAAETVTGGPAAATGSRAQRAAAGLKQQVVQLTRTKQPSQQQEQGQQQLTQQLVPLLAAQQHSPRQQQHQAQQQGGGVLQDSQHGLGRSQQGSGNGSNSTNSSRQQRQRVQHSLHSSSEPSPGSQTGMPPFWSASWQQHQQQTQKAMPGGRQPSSSNPTSRVLSPVGGSFLGMQAVAGAAVGAGQGLTPAALAAAAAGSDVPEATAERLQQLLRDGQDLHDEEAEHQTTPQTTPRAVPRTVAYHWWKELPKDQLRKCDSVVSEQQAWADMGPDKPLLAKPSVRYRKTINIDQMTPEGMEYQVTVNAQHYAVLVTDVQPCCPYPDMEQSAFAATRQPLLDRAWGWLGSMASRLAPRSGSWGVGAYRRYTADPHLHTDDWPPNDHLMRTSHEQQLLWLQQQGVPSRLSLDQPPFTPAVPSFGGAGGTPLGQLRPLRRHSQLASCQTSSEGMAGIASCAGLGPVGVAENGSLALGRASQGSQASFWDNADLSPEERLQQCQQYAQLAKEKLARDIAAGTLTQKQIRDKREYIARTEEHIQEKLVESQRMTAMTMGCSVSHLRVPGTTPSGFCSTVPTPLGVSRCNSIRSGVNWAPRGGEGAVAGATVGNPDYMAPSSRGCGAGGAGAAPYSLQPSPRSQTPMSLQPSSEAGALGGMRERVEPTAATLAQHREVPLQHRLPPTLISSSSLAQRLQMRMRVGGSARTMGTGQGLDSGDLPLHLFNSASSNCILTAPPVGGSAGGQQSAVLEGHASAPATAAAVNEAAAGQQGVADGRNSSSNSLSSRRAGGPALLTQQMTGEGLALPQQQSQQPQQSTDSLAAPDDQPTPAAQAAAELATLPPRYTRHTQQQQRSPPVSPRMTRAASSTRNSDSTNTPNTDPRRDSFDSRTSQHSGYAVARPHVVHFEKPYPPESPRGASGGGGGGMSPRLTGLSLTSQGSGSRAVSGVLMPGGAGRSLRALHGGGAAALAASAGGSSSASLPPTGRRGSSGGGHAPTPPLPVPGSGRSARGYDRQQRVSPDHLAVIIPPCPQAYPSRSGTPSTAAPAAHPLLPHPSVGSMNVAPQPWGLPADAALLSTSFSSSPLGGLGQLGSGNKGYRAATTGGIGAYPAPQPQQSFTRWSAGGVAEQRAQLGGASAVGYGTSRVASPLLSEADLNAAVTAGCEGAVQVSPNSRLISISNEAAVTAAIEEQIAGNGSAYGDGMYLDLPMRNQYGFYPIPPKVRRWARVRWAYHSQELQHLRTRESYDIVSATFSRLFPADFDRAIPVISHRGVDKLLIQWEQAVAALERAELKKLRTGREPVRLGGTCGRLFGCCAETMGCSCCSNCSDDPGVSCCCFPESSTVAIIPEVEATIKGLEDQIPVARKMAFKTAFTPSWFVLFKTQSAAMMAASTRIYAHDSTKFQVHPAPGPEEVNWQHVWMSGFERDLRTAFTWPLTILLVLFPITLVTSAVSRLEYVFCPHGGQDNAVYWEWYCEGRDQGSSLQSFIRAFMTGWLPSLLLNLWLAMVMPRLVYLIVQMEGNCFSLSAVERRIGAIFFYWDVYNMFLQGTIGSTFFQQVNSIIQSPERLPTILGAALPDSSNFFMQFIAMRALFLIWLRLCVPHGGVWQNWMHYCCCPRFCCSTCNTERDQSLTYGPRTPRYGFEMGHMLLMYLIALAFAIVSPLLLPFSVVWFAFAWLAWRHNLSYVYQRKYESGGMMWIFLFSRIVMCLVIGQLFTFCVLVVRGAYWQAFLIIAFMPAITLRYYRYCQARYAKGVEYGVPLDVANRAPRVKTGVPALAYIPPPLQTNSWGWYPEWQKIWEGWGMPTYAAA